VWLWNGVYPTGLTVHGKVASELPTFQIIYPGGDYWRDTIVTVVQNPNATKATVAFQSEDPYLQYNIFVESNDIGFRQGVYPCW
jgi:hypothetical protein